MSELFTGGGFQTAAASLSTAAPAAASDPSPAAAGASPAPASSSTQTAAPEGTSPAVPPAAPIDPAQAAAKPQGPIPFDTHKTALENARTKAAQETEAKYGWATAIAPEHRDTVGQFYKLLDADPTQAVDVLISQIANDPVHAPKLRSLFGRLLGTRPQGQPGTPQGGFPKPDTEGVDDQGNRIPLYSAERMPEIVETIRRQLTDEFSKKYGPLEQDFQTRQQQQQEASLKADAAQWADQEYARVSKYPHYQEHEPAIAAAMQADDGLTIQDAYIRIVVPTLDRTARQEVAASLHDKASASALNPAHPTSAAPTRPKTFKEALDRLPAGSL